MVVVVGIMRTTTRGRVGTATPPTLDLLRELGLTHTQVRPLLLHLHLQMHELLAGDSGPPPPGLQSLILRKGRSSNAALRR